MLVASPVLLRGGERERSLKTEYPVDWVKATPAYVLSTLQNEWRECALSEDDPERAQQGPTFATTVHEWREAMDLVSAGALGRADGTGLPCRRGVPGHPVLAR